MPIVTLPTLHLGQVDAWNIPGRYMVIRCGRRWGKTLMASTLICDGAAKGENWGLFAPEYKFTAETYREIYEILEPITKSASKVDGVIRCTSGGRVDFWTLSNKRAGRSRKYHGVVIDEAAFVEGDMKAIWEQSIKPTLLDYRGVGWVFSTPSGVDTENWFYMICTDKGQGFVEYHAPTSTNPYLPVDEIEKLKSENSPEVYRQEYLAEFVDWSGVAFFTPEMLLDSDRRPAPMPKSCSIVFATIDTAVKSGQEHDSTAVVYGAYNELTIPPRLDILDWDILQMEGASLEGWLPSVYQRLDDLSKECGAIYGSQGAYIEDKVSGSVLLQQARNHGWAATPIDSVLTAWGKSERAIAASSYVYHQQDERQRVFITQAAFEKTKVHKNRSANHLLSQLTSFRVGAKDGAADDLLDCFTYIVCIAYGVGSGARKGI